MRDSCRSNVTVRWHSYSRPRADGSLSEDKRGRDSLRKVSTGEGPRGRPAVCSYEPLIQEDSFALLLL